MKTASFLLLLSAALFLNGCVKHLSSEHVQEGHALNMTNSKTVLFIPFQNDDLHFTDKLKAALLKQPLYGQPCISAVDSGQRRKAMSGFKQLNSTVVDNATAVQLGMLAGADAVVFGRLNMPAVNDKADYIERTKCKDALCWKIKVACMERTVELAVKVMMIKVSTAESIYDETLRQKRQSRRCADDNTTFTSTPAAARQLADTIAEDFAHQLPQLANRL